MKFSERFAKTLKRVMNSTDQFVKTLEQMFKPQKLLCGMPINKKLSYFEFSTTSYLEFSISISSKLNSAFSTISKAPADKTSREKLTTLSPLCE